MSDATKKSLGAAQWTVTPLVHQTVRQMALGTAFNNLIAIFNLTPYISAVFFSVFLLDVI